MTVKSWARTASHLSTGILFAGCSALTTTSMATGSFGALPTTAATTTFNPGPLGLTDFNIYGYGPGTGTNGQTTTTTPATTATPTRTVLSSVPSVSSSSSSSSSTTGVGFVSGLYP